MSAHVPRAAVVPPMAVPQVGYVALPSAHLSNDIRALLMRHTAKEDKQLMLRTLSKAVRLLHLLLGGSLGGQHLHTAASKR